MYFHESFPFHMTYPAKGCFEQEQMLEEERARMFSYFSKDIRKLQSRIEAQLDQMEYNGSMIYDDSPDKEQIRFMSRQIQKQWNDEMQTRMEEDQIYMLFVWEIFRRREKKRRADRIC